MSGRSSLLHLAHVAHGFIGGQSGVVGLAGLGGEREHVHRHPALGLCEAPRLHRADQRHGHQARQVEVQAAFDLSFVTFAQTAEAQTRVGQARGLHDLGFGDAEFLEAGLQTAVVEQGDLNGVVHGQHLGQEFADPFVDGVACSGLGGPVV